MKILSCSGSVSLNTPRCDAKDFKSLPDELLRKVSESIFKADEPFFDQNICTLASVCNRMKSVAITLLNGKLKELNCKISSTQEKIQELKANVHKVHEFYQQGIAAINIIPDDNEQRMLHESYQFQKEIEPLEGIETEITQSNLYFSAKIANLQTMPKMLLGFGIYQATQKHLAYLESKLHEMQAIYKRLALRDTP